MDKLLEKTSACNGTSPAKGGPVKSFQKLLLWCSPRCTQELRTLVQLKTFFKVGEVASSGGCVAAPIWPHGALRRSF